MDREGIVLVAGLGKFGRWCSALAALLPDSADTVVALLARLDMTHSVMIRPRSIGLKSEVRTDNHIAVGAICLRDIPLPGFAGLLEV